MRACQDCGGHVDGIWRALIRSFSPQLGGEVKHLPRCGLRLHKLSHQAFISAQQFLVVVANRPHQYFGECQVAGDQARLCRQLQGEAGVKEAYARVNNLLREPVPGTSSLRPELRARMAWLQARLAFDANEAEQAIAFVGALPAALTDIDAELKTEIASTAVLLQAQAEFALGREPVALETLKRLRVDFPKTDASSSSAA